MRAEDRFGDDEEVNTVVVPTATTLPPAMPAGGAPSWPGATWIGEIDQDSCGPEDQTLEAGDRYSRARLLVRADGVVRGFVEVPVRAGRVDAAVLRAEIDRLPRPRDAVADAGRAALPVTVTVSTKDRADQLATLLPSLLALRGPITTVLVVDNASADTATRDLVAGLGDPRLKYVREDRVGLSYGRNRALVEADTPIVAFTDDDVVVDASWIERLLDAFVADDMVGIVTGMVPTGELRTPAQQYFEQQTHWQQGGSPTVFRRSDHRPEIRHFPLDVGHYGTGANFAVRRDLAVRLGGFNEALGIGSPTHGGEDLDMFLRVLYAGFGLAYAPDALVWHRHRSDTASLERAVEGYAISWTAWMTSLLENPATRRDAVHVGVRHAAGRAGAIVGSLRRPASSAVDDRQTPTAVSDLGPEFEHLARLASRKLLAGPRAYVVSRRAGRRIRPLLGHHTAGASA